MDNHYIKTGYRPASASFKRSFHSLTYLHNETINIWSHLLGAIVFLTISAFLYHVVAARYPTATTSDILAFTSFFTGCAVCLGMSATYHAISNHSEEVAKFSNKLDYVGIVGLIAGSFVPSVYYGFWCSAAAQRTYWTMISTISLGCATVSVHPHFRTPKYRPMRAAMFVCDGLSATVPVIHGIYLFGIQEVDHRMGLRWVVLEGLAYIAGAVIYALRIPEKWQPGTYDIFGASHQIFHILVLVGAGCHLKSMVNAFDYLHTTGQVC